MVLLLSSPVFAGEGDREAVEGVMFTPTRNALTPLAEFDPATCAGQALPAGGR